MFKHVSKIVRYMPCLEGIHSHSLYKIKIARYCYGQILGNCVTIHGDALGEFLVSTDSAFLLQNLCLLKNKIPKDVSESLHVRTLTKLTILNIF